MMRTMTTALLLLSCVALTCLQAPAALAQEQESGGQVSNEVWGVRFTAPGYEPWKDHPMRGEPQLVAAGAWSKDGCALNLSLFAAPVKTGTSPAACRAKFAGNPEPLKVDQRVTALTAEDSPLTWTSFLVEHESGIVQNQFYGYRVRDESCFELHISAISCPPLKDLALPIFESLTLEPRPDVSLETVAVSNYLKAEPTNWKVHMILGSQYLHSVKPAIPSRARLYFENAIRLAKGELRSGDAWAIQEGIGLSWLMEEDGGSAIEPFLEALSLARSGPDLETQLNETLYNLTCAYSLVGDKENACATATELLDGLKKKARRESLKAFRDDPQAENLRQAGCVEGL